jgi:protein-S-isoprenylcysteine O-methyltransferase Ste14
MSQSNTAGVDNSGVRIFPPAVYVGGLIIGYAIQWLWPFPIAPDAWSLLIRIVGVVVLASGVWLVLSAASLFGRLGTPPNPTQPTTALATDGPYRFTRNPMYFGMGLMLAGFALVGNALWPLIALVPAVGIIRMQVIDREERYLEAKFGNEYRQFKARVRRWI